MLFIAAAGNEGLGEEVYVLSFGHLHQSWTILQEQTKLAAYILLLPIDSAWYVLQDDLRCTVCARMHIGK
jgi:hypothetical protein